MSQVGHYSVPYPAAVVDSYNTPYGGTPTHATAGPPQPFAYSAFPSSTVTDPGLLWSSALGRPIFYPGSSASGGSGRPLPRPPPVPIVSYALSPSPPPTTRRPPRPPPRTFSERTRDPYEDPDDRGDRRASKRHRAEVPHAPPSYQEATSSSSSRHPHPAAASRTHAHVPSRSRSSTESRSPRRPAARSRSISPPPPPYFPPLPSSFVSRGSRQSGPRSKTDAEGHLIVVENDWLDDQYQVIRQLGEGTFSKVVECVDRASRVPVAVKVVRALKKYADTAAGELQILQRLMEHDPGDRIAFIRPLSHFMVDGHMCIVFPRLGLSLYDFLKNNRYIGFCLRDVFAIAQATLQCIEYIHGLGLIHTDLKPENILLEDDGFDELPNGAGRVPKCNRIRIIDFGSSIWESQPHAKLIQTRHYRAPEVVLGMGWSFPCDLWSVGCILAELLTGHALFQTHDSREHLHIMARVLGPFPRWFSQMADSECGRWFKPDGKLEPLDPKSDSAQFVAKLKPLRELIGKYPDFCDLVTKLLHYEPRNRLTAKQALAHAFFY